MVSNIPIMSLKIVRTDLKRYIPQFILAAVSAVLVLFFQWASILMIYMLYVLLSLLYRKKIIS
jgi:hypothetical protein